MIVDSALYTVASYSATLQPTTPPQPIPYPNDNSHCVCLHEIIAKGGWLKGQHQIMPQMQATYLNFLSPSPARSAVILSMVHYVLLSSLQARYVIRIRGLNQIFVAVIITVVV